MLVNDPRLTTYLLILETLDDVPLVPAEEIRILYSLVH